MAAERSTGEVRVILADDHELMRSGVRLLLEQVPGVQVVAEASDGEELLRIAGGLPADLVFTDISMPGMDGFQAIAGLRRLKPELPVVVLSMHDSADMVRKAVDAGAQGYLMKNASAQELRLAVDSLLVRGSYFSPAVASALLKPAAPGPDTQLTARQVQILTLLARGLSSKQVAYELGLSAKTVDVHRANIMERLGISDLPGLTRYAIRHKLIEV